MFGLDGVSRPSSVHDSAGFDLNGTCKPPSSGSEASLRGLTRSSSQGYIPWGSHMLTQEGKARNFKDCAEFCCFLRIPG